jgi:FKBP-type peptidyl-prolyl cis-trans isomerase SlyD
MGAHMQVAEKKAVTIKYTLRDEEGAVLDSTDGRDPLTYLHGAGNLVPGVEEALEGKSPGDEIKVVVPPEKGYGEREEENVRNVPVRKLPPGKIQPGAQVQLNTTHGPVLALVKAIKGDYATIDLNHPLAGKTLRFELEVVEVRDATEEEMAHGHVHGPGEHH